MKKELKLSRVYNVIKLACCIFTKHEFTVNINKKPSFQKCITNKN